MNKNPDSESSKDRLIELLQSGQEHSISNEVLANLSDEERQEFHEALQAIRLLNKAKPSVGQQSIDTAAVNDAETPTDATNQVVDALPGIQQLGHYKILQTLGRGGFGIVVKGLDTKLGRTVALKVPKVDLLLQGQEATDRFAREARLVAMLSHPAIVPIYETGADGSILYIASAYCNGGNLARWFSDQNKNIAPMFAARIAARLAEAIQHAHSRGVIHRDLKPGNVLLDFDEGVFQKDHDSLIDALRITDFGLAKFVSEDQTVTQTGATIGTPAYMSPEQARGAVDKIGPASDIYALGAILYELLTGSPPIVGESNIATMRAIETEAPIPPRNVNPKISADLSAICIKCLEKDPRHRYGSAQLLEDDLRRLLRSEPVNARAVGPLTRLSRWGQRNPALAVLLAALLASLSIGLGVALWQKSHTDTLNRQLVNSNNQFQQARTEAIRFSSRNRQLLDEYLFVLSDVDLMDDPNAIPDRERLLKIVDRQLEQTLNENPQDPLVKRDRVRTLAGLARLRSFLGQSRDQEKHARQAIDLMSKIVNSEEATEFDLELMADAHWLLAKSLGWQSRIAQAQEHHRQAIDWQKRALQRGESNNVEQRLACYLSKYAWLLYSWYGYHPDIGEDEFRRPLKDAGKIFRKMGPWPPEHHRATDGSVCIVMLLTGLSKIGFVGLNVSGDLSELDRAVESIEESRKFATTSTVQFPNVEFFERHSAACDFKLGQIYGMADQFDQANHYYLRALEQYATLREKRPQSYHVAQSYIDCLVSWVGTLYRHKDHRKCEETARQGIDASAEFVEHFADQGDWFLARQSGIHYWLGRSFQARKQRENADRQFQLAAEITKQLIENPVLVIGARLQHGSNLAGRGLNRHYWRQETGEMPGPICIDSLTQAIPILEEALNQNPQTNIRYTLNRCYRVLGMSLGLLQRYEEGARHLIKATKYAPAQIRRLIPYDLAIAALWQADYQAIPERLDMTADILPDPGQAAYQQAAYAAMIIGNLEREFQQRSKLELAEARHILVEYATTCLDKARAEGYFDLPQTVERFQNASAFDNLRNEPSFQDFMQEIQ